MSFKRYIIAESTKFLYNIRLISINDSVPDGATNKSVLNIYSMITSANEYEPDLLSATRV